MAGIPSNTEITRIPTAKTTTFPARTGSDDKKNVLSMNILAIIPARGGSKGIPRKNIQPVAGTPLIVYSISAARLSKNISRIIVSTDDPEIAEISKKYGAEIVWRPVEISGDTASSESALLHVLEYLEGRENYIPDLMVFLQCTSPLTTADDIDGTVETLLEKNADSALAVTPFFHFLWKQNPDRTGVSINHDKNTRPMRQQMELQYLETGSVYVMRTEGFKKARHRFFGKTVLYNTPLEHYLEIDNPVDLSIAETRIQNRNAIHKESMLPDIVSGIVFDFDGVFTDNRVIIHDDGSEAVICNRSDGLGISQLRSLNIPLLVISTEKNPVVKKRCEKLGIPCEQNVADKLITLKKWTEQHQLNPDQIIYVGNDINDLTCMKFVGCGISVADAHPEVKTHAKIVLSARGGDGAIRELCDLIMRRYHGKNRAN